MAVLSFALESNVFNPEPRRLSAFQILEGEAYERNERQAGFVRNFKASSEAALSLFDGVDIAFVCLYRGFCGGLVPAGDFEAMKTSAADGLRALVHSRGLRRVDGVLLDLHGAMGAEGCDDAEAELAEAVRSAIPVGLVAASFDLHGNFSERLGSALDLVTAYKTMPHVDMEETKTKCLRMLLTCLKHDLQPAVVVRTIPAILPGDTVLSTEGTGRALYRWMRDLEPTEWRTPELAAHLGPPAPDAVPREGLMDAAFFVGHGHADEPRVGAAVVLTCESGQRAQGLRELAREIAQWYWDQRATFVYPSGSPLCSPAEALRKIDKAMDAGERVLVGDVGDNVNAGASGDVPYLLRLLLARHEGRAPHIPSPRRPRVLIAGLVDASAVDACLAAAAEGRSVLPRLTVGAQHAAGAAYGDGCEALDLTNVTLLRLVNNNDWALLRVAPTVILLLQRAAWAFHGRADVQRLGPAYSPDDYDVVVVKRGNVESLVGPMLGEGSRIRCLMVNTPGANAHPIPARPRLRHGMYPVCSDAEWTAPRGLVLV